MAKKKKARVKTRVLSTFLLLLLNAVSLFCSGVIWFYQLNWWRRFVTVKSLKADVLNVSPSSIALRRANAWNVSEWPIWVINSVENIKLPRYIIPPTQHHSFFSHLPSIMPCSILFQNVSNAAARSINQHLHGRNGCRFNETLKRLVIMLSVFRKTSLWKF